MDKNMKKCISWVKKNKFLSVIIFLGILVIGFFSFTFLGAFSPTASYGAIGEKGMTSIGGLERNIMAPGWGGIHEESDYIESHQETTEYQIREGSASIETENADSDYQKIKSNAEGYNGWVETISKNENYKTITLSATLKIPSENFDAYADWLLKNFDVKNSNLKLYRISVERQQDEIEILTKTLNAYDGLFDKAESMELSVEGIELMDKLTQKKLNIMRQMRNYGYSVKNIQEKSNYATLGVTLTQKKDIELMPEDLGRELMTKLRDAVRNITNALLDLVTIPVVIFVNLIVWIVYALVVLIPLFIIYKIGLRIYKWLDKKIK